MYLQRERRSPVRAVSAAKSAVLAGCARVLCEREGVASGARWRRCGACPWRVLYERCAVHGAARCGDAAAPEGGAAKGSCEGAQGNADGDRRVRFFLRRASAPWATSCRPQCSASAVQWAVRLRRGWTLVGCTGGCKAECRAGTRNETRGWDARPDRVHAAREGGCAAQGGPCAAARAVCVWAWRGGCREAEKRTPHACRCGPPEPPRPPRRERGQPLCVRHTARRRLWGVQLARQGLGAGRGREGSPHAT